MKHQQSLDTLCAALTNVMGIEAPTYAAMPSQALCQYAESKFGGEKADRVFMFNPDAIGTWIYQKYPSLMKEVQNKAELELPFCTVMPSVTPVCFGTMYTGAQPSVHGIQKYEKPVIKIDTIFDALIRCGKKPVIVAQTNCSMANIYLERDMDYFIYPTVDEVNAKAAELILEDKYDFIAVYNGNYDSRMHKCGPESIEALAELHANSHTFATFCSMIENNWKHHNTLVGFAMDHGCHEIDGGCGSHGLDMDEDLNITHLYQAYPKQK